MLRTALLAATLVASLVGAGLLLAGVRSPGAQLLIAGAVIGLGTVFERWRYRGNQARPGAPWERTDERFEDPHTGETFEVYFDPRSGERRYVRAEPDPARLRVP